MDFGASICDQPQCPPTASLIALVAVSSLLSAALRSALYSFIGAELSLITPAHVSASMELDVLYMEAG